MDKNITSYLEKHRDTIDLLREYKDTYDRVHKLANKVRKEFNKTTDKEKIAYRRMVYDTEQELLEIVIALERYLPNEFRYYTKREIEKHKKLTFSKSSDIGFIYYKQEDINIEEIVENKILKNELLTMLRSLLTDKQYSCVHMYYWEGMTQEQIANKLIMDKTTVNKYIRTSIVKIKNSDYFLNIIKELI